MLWRLAMLWQCSGHALTLERRYYTLPCALKLLNLKRASRSLTKTGLSWTTPWGSSEVANPCEGRFEMAFRPKESFGQNRRNSRCLCRSLLFPRTAPKESSKKGALGRLLGASWGPLGASWSLLGASWAPLEGSCEPLGVFLAPLGSLLGLLGGLWAPLGRLLAPLGVSWELLGVVLEPQSVRIGSNRWESGGIGGNRWPSVGIGGNRWESVGIGRNRWESGGIGRNRWVGIGGNR